MQNPLLVTDAMLAKLDITAKTLQIVKDAGLNCAIFSDMSPNPVGQDVDKGVAVLRAGGHDGVIAFGGGAAMDVAKAIALMAHQTRPLWDFEDIGDYWTRVDERAMVPCVAVPTTSGTGSEVGRCSVIVHEEDHRKAIIFHPKMLPPKVIADPELTIGLPAKVTAAVGMDALSHNLEAYCAPGYHPQADGIALEGMRLIHRSLIKAYTDGSDVSAQSGHAGGLSDGRHRLPKGAWGHARHESSPWRAPRCAPRSGQCHCDALCPQAQLVCHRRSHGRSRPQPQLRGVGLGLGALAAPGP